MSKTTYKAEGNRVIETRDTREETVRKTIFRGTSDEHARRVAEEMNRPANAGTRARRGGL